MTISVFIIAGNFPYGNPGSLGEPLGLWVGEADVTGDASGGFIEVAFEPQNPTETPLLPDQRRQYVYFVDGVSMQANSDPGNFWVSIDMHMARSNIALAERFRYRVAVDTLAAGGSFVPSRPMLDSHVPRIPIFWDPQELAAGSDIIVNLRAEVNTLATIYNMRAYGRYYDRQVLSNRAFGRLISPVAISQFE